MAQKKYRPGMNCEKTGKYTCYDKDGNEMYGDVDVRLFHKLLGMLSLFICAA